MSELSYLLFEFFGTEAFEFFYVVFLFFVVRSPRRSLRDIESSEPVISPKSSVSCSLITCKFIFSTSNFYSGLNWWPFFSSLISCSFSLSAWSSSPLSTFSSSVVSTLTPKPCSLILLKAMFLLNFYSLSASCFYGEIALSLPRGSWTNLAKSSFANNSGSCSFLKSFIA